MLEQALIQTSDIAIESTMPKSNERCFVKRKLRRRWEKTLLFPIDDPTASKPFSKSLSIAMHWNDEFVNLAILEYKKFMFLCGSFPNENFAPSLHVDTVWHMHLLYTHSYHRFCQEALDCRFLHHEPSAGAPSEEQFHENAYSSTLDLYQSFFGFPPSEIWGERIRPSVEES